MNSIAVYGQNALITKESYTVNELYLRWLTFIGDKADKTVETYTRNTRRWLSYVAEMGIQAPQKSDIISYKEYLLARYKPTTAQAYLMAVKLLYQWAEDEGLYANIAKRVSGVKLDKEFKRDFLSPDEARRLLATIDRRTESGKRDYAIIVLMMACGLRTIEIARADVEDIDRKYGGDILYIKGKGHLERTNFVKLTAPVKAAITEYLAERGDIEPDENGRTPLFSSVAHRNGGERMTTKSISRLTKEALVAAGLERDALTAHSLRHSAAIINLMNGGTIEETQTLLRHTSSDTTRIYTHAVERIQNKSEKRVSEVLFG